MTVTVHQLLVQQNTARSNMLDKAVKTHSGKEYEGFNSCIIIRNEREENISKG